MKKESKGKSASDLVKPSDEAVARFIEAAKDMGIEMFETDTPAKRERSEGRGKKKPR